MSCGPASVLVTKHGNRRHWKLLGPQRPQEGEAVHLRHVDVDDQQVERLQQELFQRLQAVQRLVDLEAGALERRPVIRPHQRGVVDDQDPFPGAIGHARTSSGLR